MRIAGTIELDGSTLTLDQAVVSTTLSSNAPIAPITVLLPKLNSTLATIALVETLENKTLTNTSIISITASNFTLEGAAGTTKFSISATSPRLITIPDADTTMVGTDVAQSLTLKTMDGDNNTFSNIDITALKTQLADADKMLRRDAAGVIISGNAVPNTSPLVTTDSTSTLTNKQLTAPRITAGTDIDTDVAGTLAIGTTNATTLSIGRAAQIAQFLGGVTVAEDVTITGSLTVNGAVTTVNTATLDVEDANITVNKNGTKVGAQGAGITVDTSGDGAPYAFAPSLVFNETLASGWEIDKGGVSANPTELVDVDSAQVLENKSIDGDTNTITDLALSSLKTTANLDVFVQRDGFGAVIDSPKAVPVGDVVGTSDAQVINNKQLLGSDTPGEGILLDFTNGGAEATSTTNRLIVAGDLFGSLPAPSAATKGAVYYDATNDRLVLDIGDQLVPVGFDGSGSSPAAALQDTSLSNADFIFENTGTNTDKTVFKKRVGDVYHVWGYLTLGTINPASFAEITLAAGITLDTSKLPPFSHKVGEVALLSTMADERVTYDIFYDGSTTNKLYISLQTSGGEFDKTNTDVLFVDNESISFVLEIPVTELSGSFATSLTWAPTILTGDATLLIGQEVFARAATAATALTFALPTPAQLGDRVRVIDAEDAAATFNIILDRNGSNINGAAANYTLTTNGAAVEAIYMNSTQGWRILTLG